MMNRIVMMGAIGAALAAPALAHDGDIGVRLNGMGALETYLVETEPSSGFEAIERVFASELGTIEFGPFGSDDPGYYTDALSEGATVGFNVLSELKRWNGAGFDGGLTETLQFGQFLGTPGEITVDSGAGFVGGFGFATVGGGFFDEHISYILLGSGGDPADGIYLIEMELTLDGVQNSDPYWIVFNLNGDEADHDIAIEWVVDNLVPAPGAAGMIMLSGLALVRRRRN